jgi:thiosulfate/3-mercaptopyruvate sulfurtransferase
MTKTLSSSPRLAAPLLALGLALTAWATTAHAAEPLLTPTGVQAAAGQDAVRIIDIRDPKAYGERHIPGALNAPYGKWRGPATNPGELPELPKLTELVQSLGLTPATHAIVVSSGADATDFGAAARVYWTLKLLGLKELSVLNGGMKAWSAQKLPQDNQAVTIARSAYQPQLDTSLIATREDVGQHVRLSNAALVDSRPDAFYQGKTRAPAAKLSACPASSSMRAPWWTGPSRPMRRPWPTSPAAPNPWPTTPGSGGKRNLDNPLRRFAPSPLKGDDAIGWAPPPRGGSCPASLALERAGSKVPRHGEK